ncbi:PspA/IM30 family protein [Aeromicrobium chenweiae]|uniref:Phage shock protein A n=1 Tax=Aeromicrobium chenweiae TaxID=2079793 RepID=A0A2S0WKS5_9ACTN|nr:PspA/IM30 family protein [Aeromicrobium chenweiae]AWB91948.1 phage shock protein A [Aeromicrobium chenweiae]TGN32799.1 PspA/IM30 family protein [Aeromicrobium chenweiae]
MSIGQRVARWWSSRRAGGEDAESLKDRLDETYRNQTALLRQVRRGVADVATSRKRVELQLTSIAQQAAQLDDQARQAVDRGDDDAARGFLTRKVMLEKTAADLQERHDALKAEEDKLEVSAMKIEQEVEGFRVRKDTLAARHTAAAARAEINSATSGIGSAVSDVSQAMESAERRTRELEAQSDAVDELVAEGIVTKPGESPDDALRRQFDAALDGPEVDRQLDEISHRKDDSGTH